MKPLLSLAARSAWNRRFALGLVLLSVALSSFLLLSLQRLREDVRASFAQAVSGADLVVGPRTGSVQLLLSAVFRIGQPTHALRLSSVQALAEHPAVDWVVPLALGDSYAGFPVLATTDAYFRHFRYGQKQALQAAQGRFFGEAAPDEAVLGAEVARRLGLAPGARLVLAHGDGAFREHDHGEHPFTVVGVLHATGTPVDRTVHVSLQAMGALHPDELASLLGGLPAGMAPLGGRGPAGEHAEEHVDEHAHEHADRHAKEHAGEHDEGHDHDHAAPTLPRHVNAALVGLKNRAAVFAVQRWVAEYRGEPLAAVLPGVTLDELWQVVGLGEQALLAMTGLVALVSLAGLVAVILAGLNERRRELAVLRAVGAGPGHVWLLLAAEGAGLTLLGATLGLLLHLAAAAALAPWLQAHFGIVLQPGGPSAEQGLLFAAIVAAGWLASLLPGWRAFRLSLADGLTPRI